MSRNSNKVVDILLERRLTDQDIQARNKGIKDRLDKIGELLNALKGEWNKVHTGSPIRVRDYEPKDFE